MATKAKCPKCQAAIVLSEFIAEPYVRCESCGAKLMLPPGFGKRSAAPQAGEAPGSAAAVPKAAGSAAAVPKAPAPPRAALDAPRQDTEAPRRQEPPARNDIEPAPEDAFDDLDSLMPGSKAHGAAEGAAREGDDFDDVPTQRKVKSKDGKRSKSKKANPERPREPAAAEDSRRPSASIIAAGVAAALAVVLGGVWLAKGKGGPGAGGAPGVAAGEAAPEAQAEFGAADRSSDPVTIDAPPAGAQPPPAAAPAPLFVPAPPFVEAQAATLATLEPETAAKITGRQNQPPAAEPPALWQAAADPAVEAADDVMPLGLEFPFPTLAPDDPNLSLANPEPKKKGKYWEYPPQRHALSHLGFGEIPPIFAGRNGPFMMLAPPWDKLPYLIVRSENVDPEISTREGTLYRVEDEPQPPIPVIDLRTGEQAGAFDWQIPWWMGPWLSPDGRRLVGPWPIPIWGAFPSDMSEDDQRDREPLYVWERDSQSRPKPLAVGGYALTAAFADNTTLVVLVESPTPQLQVWNTETAERLGEIPLPDDQPREIYIAARHGQQRQWRHVNPNWLKISPGGRFALIADGRGVQMASLPDLTLRGRVPLEIEGQQFSQVHAVEFLPEGEEFVVVHQVSRGGRSFVRFVLCGVTDGRIRRQVDLEGGGVPGPAWRSPLHASAFLLGDLTSPKYFDLDKSRVEYVASDFPAVMRMTASGPLLICRVPNPYDENGPKERSLHTVERSTVLDVVEKAVLVNELDLPKRPPLTPAPPAPAVSSPAPPAAWSAMKPSAPPPPISVEALPTVHFPDAWNRQHAFVLTESTWDHIIGAQTPAPTGARVERLAGTRFDFSGPQPVASDVVLWDWAVPPTVSFDLRRNHPRFPVAISADGARIAAPDPQQPGRVDLWTADGRHELGFLTNDLELPPRWLAFDAEGRLLTVAAGELAAWQVDLGKVSKTYAVQGGYTFPVALAPGASFAAVSRVGSFDLIDTATGTCLNRCGAGIPGSLVQISVSPDGGQVAALMIESRDTAAAVIHSRKLLNADPTPASIVVWDLSSGAARMLPVKVTTVPWLGWVGAEHLCLHDGQTHVLDLKLNARTLVYGAAEWDCGPDGRLWVQTVRPAAGDIATTAPEWRSSTLTGARTKDEAPYFDPDRTLMDLTTSPLQIEVDIGDAAQGEKHGRMLAQALVDRGYRIGPGGFRARVTAQVRDTSDQIQFGPVAVTIPEVIYDWRLSDPAGREVWNGTTRGGFLGYGSKYYEPPSAANAPQDPLPIGVTVINFNFKGLEPKRAILDEIFETGHGIGPPQHLPRQSLFGAGRHVPVQVQLEFSTTSQGG